MLKLQKVRDQIFLVWFDDHVDMVLTLLRPMNAYESADIGLRVPDLKYRDVLERMIRHGDELTFDAPETDLAYNLPSYVIEDCVSAQWPRYEAEDLKLAGILAAIRAIQPQGFFYLMAVSVGSDLSGEDLRHEFAHALWATENRYKIAMQRAIANAPLEDIERVCNVLADHFYGPDVFEDEIQAYLATGPLEEMDISDSVRKPFEEIFNRYARGVLCD